MENHCFKESFRCSLSCPLSKKAFREHSRGNLSLMFLCVDLQASVDLASSFLFPPGNASLLDQELCPTHPWFTFSRHPISVQERRREREEEKR